MSRVQITRLAEIRLDLAELAKKCRLAASEDVLDFIAGEVESDEKAGLLGKEGWPSKGGKKGKDGN